MGGYTIRMLVLNFQKDQGELHRGNFLEILKCLGYETLINLQKARKFGVKAETPYPAYPTGSLYFRTRHVCSLKYLQYGAP